MNRKFKKMGYSIYKLNDFVFMLFFIWAFAGNGLQVMNTINLKSCPH